MLGREYLRQLRELFDRVEATQLEAIDRAAEAIADSLASGGAFHIHDTGHMLNQELIARAGGLMAATALRYTFSVENPTPEVTRPKKASQRPDRLGTIGDLVLDMSNVKSGDVILISSVSGRNASSIDIAIRARKRGAKVIALTSLAYSQRVASTHPSGQRLFEAADVALDNCGVEGDACLEVEGLATKAIPTSGIGAATVAWMVCAEVIEKLLSRGIRPHVYMSVNRDGGEEFNARERAEFEKTGV